MLNAEMNQKSKGAIICEIVANHDGWTLSATIPPDAPTSDRSLILQWLKDYCSLVRRIRPFYVVQFQTTLTGYAVKVIASESPAALIAAGISTLGQRVHVAA
jgi:hypothetical protein